ncbi:hypothetical protein ACDT12_13160 [Staphylococcus aureus]
MEIPNKDSVVDLGIIIGTNLNFKEHIRNQINKANMMLGLIKRHFKNLSVGAFLCLYKSLVRSQLEYAVQVWNPHNVGLIESLEKVQKRATKLVPICRNKSYSERLKILNLPSLYYRRKRGDLILLYNIINGMCDGCSCPALTPAPETRTRGHNNKKLCTRLAHKDCRKYYFSNRVVSDWNSLPQSVVDVPNVLLFKILLDRSVFGDSIFNHL